MDPKPHSHIDTGGLMMAPGLVLPFGPVGVPAFAAIVVVGLLLLAVFGAKTRVSHFYPSGASMWCMPASIDVLADRSIDSWCDLVGQS